MVYWVNSVDFNGTLREATSEENISAFGHKTLVWIQDAGLLIIAIATIIAVGIEVKSMNEAKTVTLADLLLLFIYLDSGKLPVRMPLYIASVALARYMILDMKSLDTWRMLGLRARPC